jgi:PIN domain nuclease of toxin-antitoxin system
LKILLDTCTFLWIVKDDRLLSPHARQRLLEPEHEFLLSVVSAWEISIKYALGRLPLPTTPDEFVTSERHRHGIAKLRLSEAASLIEFRLPTLHKDPFDRMLICQAISDGLVLLTPDPLIRQYPGIEVEW